MVLLKICGVHCGYESTKVLEEVSFSASEGGFVGVLGPNGAGKTTLLRTISRTLKPSLGVVLIDDKDVSKIGAKELAREVAVVPQETHVTFSLTALDIVLMGRNPYLGRLQLEDSGDFAVARKAMETTNTWHLADRQIIELSGGEKQRVIIARALAQSPKVLLLDEPTLHLDISSQIEIMDLLTRLCRENRLLVVAVIHDLNLATRYCDKIILINQGRIASIGKPEDVLKSETIKEVFKVEVLVRRNPITNLLYVIPFTTLKPKKVGGRGVKVHLICGGGSGTPLMRLLAEEGWEATAGVLNVLDTDHETAQMLGIPVVSEAPFSPITEEAYSRNFELIRNSDAVILTVFPVGFGNLKNLEAALEAAKKGVPTVLVLDRPIHEVDFAEGSSSRYFEEILKAGAVSAGGFDEALQVLGRLKK